MERRVAGGVWDDVGLYLPNIKGSSSIAGAQTITGKRLVGLKPNHGYGTADVPACQTIAIAAAKLVAALVEEILMLELVALFARKRIEEIDSYDALLTTFSRWRDKARGEIVEAVAVFGTAPLLEQQQDLLHAWSCNAEIAADSVRHFLERGHDSSPRLERT